MTRRWLIFIGAGIALSVFFFVLMLSGRTIGVSAVTLGFKEYAVVEGKHSLVLVLTNGSSFRISEPGDTFTLFGDTPYGESMMSSRGPSTHCGFFSSRWGRWQFQFPKPPSVAPGATLEFAVPAPEGPYTLRVRVPCTTIPFRDRLPHALRSLWPLSSRNKPFSFSVETLPIPPPGPIREQPWVKAASHPS
jgi:hypothetical protein